MMTAGALVAASCTIEDGGATAAVRAPRGFAHELIARLDLPLAVPSANRSGGISPTRAEHVLADLGDRVEKGQVVAMIYPTGRTGLPPTELRSRRAGLFTARHFPGLVKPGDCVAVIAEEVAG